MPDYKIVIFGAGEMGKTVLKYCRYAKIEVLCIIDNDQKKWGKYIHGIKVISPAKAAHKYKGAFYIIANMKDKHIKTIEAQLQQFNIPADRICGCALPKEIPAFITDRISYSSWEDKNLIYDTLLDHSVRGKIVTAADWIQNRRYLYEFRRLNVPEAESNAVAVCAIFKDEAPYLREWIEFHKLIGVSHFYLYNNLSGDNYKDILKPYIMKNEVTLEEWPYEQKQIEAYIDCVNKYRTEAKWIGFIDLDEFIVPIHYDRIDSFLKKFNQFGCVVLYWKFFCTSGIVKRKLTDFVIEDFHVCMPKNYALGKCFYNTSFCFVPQYEENQALHHSMWTGLNGKMYPPVNCFGNIVLGSDRKQFLPKDASLPIQINHYFSKSLKEYEDKMNKGDAYFKKNPHDLQYLFAHEKRCTAVDYHISKYLAKLKMICSEAEEINE